MTSIEQIRPEHTWQLRRDVLYPSKTKHEMEMPEDVDGIHFGAFTDNKLAGVVSLFQKGTSFQFRKLAVDAAMQKAGIGSSLLAYITKYTEENGGTRIWCNARTDAIGFYLKLEFVETEDVFSKNGIDYVIMEKMLTPPLTLQESR
ncbi:GNAT family N-acetyltransferase [Mucilaginibacter sp. OK098]|uniref:GNAT family N-acetyltransferase n=1 Tax=Mucilaginibacter sp. OK098 TaxID=1855297 RepID=UPI00091DBA2F|nr:GNAT family N-acetyltransferase [Mucilaginibacter sp. OK098]SHM56489.1 Acetyltransferase (GNAT) domain-containing protein [Mucilaginibacter sp. OK098]